jgi:hypothetical protein
LGTTELDFTLKAYGAIIDAGKASGYEMRSVGDWIDAPRSDGKVIVLRHDVDRRPGHALAMARLEAGKGAFATYFFRRVGSAYAPSIVREIAAMGHEVGYHYEDFYLAKYQPDEAFRLFRQHLADFRAIAPIRTIAMHGSPFAKFGNMEIWKHHGFEASDVKDCILSADWSQFVYFTDTGRSFDARSTNLRDEIPGKKAPGVATSATVATYLVEQQPPRVQINVHPERWTDQPLLWVRQLGVDLAANSVKLGLRALRRHG